MGAGMACAMRGEHQQVAEDLPDRDDDERRPCDRCSAGDDEGHPDPDAHQLQRDVRDDLLHGEGIGAVPGPGEQGGGSERGSGDQDHQVDDREKRDVHTWNVPPTMRGDKRRNSRRGGKALE
ncbi:hypothetical protein [Leucobacter soli]|uniref:hypothetical protein n=1 Tax=Leucobacter soli TaxID=2812850 RepID=UPI0036223C8F